MSENQKKLESGDSQQEISPEDIKAAANYMEISPDAEADVFVRIWQEQLRHDIESGGDSYARAPQNFGEVMEKMGFPPSEWGPYMDEVREGK